MLHRCIFVFIRGGGEQGKVPLTAHNSMSIAITMFKQHLGRYVDSLGLMGYGRDNVGGWD